jgi:hypothetical protein
MFESEMTELMQFHDSNRVPDVVIIAGHDRHAPSIASDQPLGGTDTVPRAARCASR